MAASRTIGSDSIRRATNASTSEVGGSSHCASSTTSRTGASDAASDTRSSAAMAIRKCSGAASSVRPKAASSAARWTSRSSLARPRTGRISRCNPANGRFASDCTPVVDSTAQPRSRAARSHIDSRCDFPIPGSPRTTSAWPRAAMSSNSDDMRLCSSRRPSNGDASSRAIPTMTRSSSHPARDRPPRAVRWGVSPAPASPAVGGLYGASA